MTDDRTIIAIVDSDDSLRARLRVLFGAAGLTVELFKSAEEYLKRSKSHLPNCTVLDIQLPGISGLDLQSRLAKAKRKTPLVFLTAQNDARMSVQAMKAGAIDFLTKPFQVEELLEAVRSGIEHDLAARLQKQTLDELRTRLASLSPRERETMVLLSAGQGPKQIAGQLGVCTQTARVHSGRIMAKMEARSIADLVRMVDRLEHLSREGEELRFRINTKCRVTNRGGATVRRSDAHTCPDGHSVGNRGQSMPPVPSLS
jgi:FixJ family two-component response regulator